MVREKTDDPFMDELNLVADKVQDMQLVRAVCWCGSCCQQRRLGIVGLLIV